MKKAYFASVCLMPPFLAVLILLVFLGPVRIPPKIFLPVFVYFWIGLVVVLVDLWRSALSQETKVRWTALNLFFGLIALPAYWFMVLRVRTRASETNQ